MSEDERKVPSQSSEELNVSSEGDSRKIDNSRYRFIIYCGLDKKKIREN